MTRFVLDCSVTMAWAFEDESDAYADDVLRSLSSNEAVVPKLWAIEVCNVLLVAERRQRISVDDSTQFVADLLALPIHEDDGATRGLMAVVLDLAGRHGLSAYDAAYLDLALREMLPIATLDAKLRSASAAAGLAVFATA